MKVISMIKTCPSTHSGVSILVEIDALFARLDQKQDIDQVRLEIAELITKILTDNRDNLGCWEKEHLVYAIALFAQNVNSTHPHTTAWLKASLINIEKALVPPEQRSESCTSRGVEFNSFTFAQLNDYIRFYL
jgi:hypothetical protein